jgi:hypothetical protein
MKGRVDLLEQIRQQSIRARSQALIKEQRERYMGVKLAPGSSASGGGRSGCYPSGGVLLKVTQEIEPGFFAYQDFFLAQSGSRNGRPSYELPFIFTEGDLTAKLLLKASWNGSLWEFIQEEQTPEGDRSILGATSTELYGSWDTTVPGPVLFETVPGAEFQCQYRYCASAIGFDGDGAFFTPFMVALWIDTPLDGPPNVYVISFGETPTLFWREDLQQWVIDDGPDAVEIGGTRDSLPAGTFDLGDGFELTISEGFCDPNQNPNA